MRLHCLTAFALLLACGACASAQNAASTPPSSASSAQDQGQHGGRGGPWGGGMAGAMGAGRGVTGTVTDVAADHYILKTDAGETYTVHFSVNTRIIKQAIQRPAPGETPEARENREQPAPQTLKPTDIHVGDALAAMGEIDVPGKSVGAVVILQIDPERARMLREFQANFGKTWLVGRVTAINEAKVSLLSTVDNAAHAFVADENTTFRKRREPITLADIQVGDMVRVEGAVKDGVFVATAVSAMGQAPAGGATVPRSTPPAAQPK